VTLRYINLLFCSILAGAWYVTSATHYAPIRLSYRPHYASCLSVCSVPYGLIIRKQKKRTKIKIGTHVPQGTTKQSANFQLKRSKVKVTGRQKHRKLPSCLLPGNRSSAGGSGADCKLGLTTVRPNLLSAPETLGNWTGGRISRRHSAAICFLVKRHKQTKHITTSQHNKLSLAVHTCE